MTDVKRPAGPGSVDALVNSNSEINDPNALKSGQDFQLPQAQESPERPPSAPPAPGPFGDPLAKSLFQALLKRDQPAPLPGAVLLYAKGGPAGAGTAPAKTSPHVSPDVASLLAEGAKVPQAKEDFTAAQKAIAAGDYSTAYAHLESLMRKDGEDVLSAEAVEGAKTVRDQVEFLARMQKAGIQADYPPTEAQLTAYFATLKNDPAGARQAFKDYAQLFHVHPANLPGHDFDVKYSDDNNAHNTRVPNDWSEVANRPSKDKAKYIGKQINDCEGFAFMAEKLLGAAGFKLAHHITAHPGPNNAGHSMAAFTHPKEKGFTVTSNDGVFRDNAEKAAAMEGLEYAAGKTTGHENYYVGKTMAESQSEMMDHGRKL